VIGISVSGHEWTTANEVGVEGMITLTAGSMPLLLGGGKAGVKMSEQAFGLNAHGKAVLGDIPIIDMTALASASWPEVVGGPEGKYEGGVFLIEAADRELIGVTGSIEGRQIGSELTGGGAVGMRVEGNNVIGGSGDLYVKWSDGLQLRASVSNGPNATLALVRGSAHVHGVSDNSVVSFMKSYMLDEGQMDFGVDVTLLNAGVVNVTGSLTSSDMRARRSDSTEGAADVACLLLDAGGVLLPNQGKMKASSDFRFTNFGKSYHDGKPPPIPSLWDATLEHAMIRVSLLDFDDTMTETNDIYEEPPSCNSTSSGVLSFAVGKLSDFRSRSNRLFISFIVDRLD